MRSVESLKEGHFAVAFCSSLSFCLVLDCYCLSIGLSQWLFMDFQDPQNWVVYLLVIASFLAHSAGKAALLPCLPKIGSQALSQLNVAMLSETMLDC